MSTATKPTAAVPDTAEGCWVDASADLRGRVTPYELSRLRHAFMAGLCYGARMAIEIESTPDEDERRRAAEQLMDELASIAIEPAFGTPPSHLS
ncbi:hypothetical protein MASR1M6_00110 [Rubrivivax sp.]